MPKFSFPQSLRAGFAAALCATAFALPLVLTGCVSIPKKASAVSPFNTEDYLNTWYEIARMDFRFERNMRNVTATYTKMSGSHIRVRNRGYDTTKGNWKESLGKARQLRGRKDGRLKVSFFGPFYSGYNVVRIDPNYRYALVAGDNLKYLWILSRTPDLPAAIRSDYLKEAARIGYDTARLVWTDHRPLQ